MDLSVIEKVNKVWKELVCGILGSELYSKKNEWVDKWWMIIYKLYSAPNRYYHTLLHIKTLLDFAKKYSHQIKNMNNMEVAIFFHDIVYNSSSPGGQNEDDSITMVKIFLEELKEILPQNHRKDKIDEDTIVEYIASTKSHTVNKNKLDTDLNYFLDFDLAILCAPTQDYLSYAEQIRMEYNHMDNSTYIKGRIQVLNHLMSLDIYKTLDFKTMAPLAISNMQTEINKLQKHTPPKVKP